MLLRNLRDRSFEALQQVVPVQHLPRPLRPHHGRQQLLPARGGRPGGGGVPWPRRGRGDQLHLRAAVRQLGVRSILRPVPVCELLRSHEVSFSLYFNVSGRSLNDGYYIFCPIPSAAYVLLTTLVLADLFGPENFSNSFGLLLLFQGVATFAGPPIVGKNVTYS